MKKSAISLLLTLCMALSLFPVGAFAAEVTPAPGMVLSGAAAPPVELGSVADYQNVLDATYDENGLRVARIGYNIEGQLRGSKYGIINRDGNWVAQPIYDEIVCYAWDMRLRAFESMNAMPRSTVTPVVFIGGYTQAKRDGKMGLLNQNGEEVIPCQYDYVQMPSEGMAAVYKTIDKRASYLGYWSLEENREVVAPNKYVTYQSYIGSPIGDPDIGSSSRQKPAGDYNQVHDFMDGYALVTLPDLLSTNVTRRGITYPGKISTIIDKTGKEVLPKPYPIIFETDDYSTYPQKGCYLSFIGKIDLSNYLWTRYSGNPKAKGDIPLDVSYTYGTGLASPAGVQIPPTYTTGVIASAGEGQFFINPAAFSIYPEANLVITKVDAWPGIFGGGADTAIDLKGKTKVPPMQDLTNDAFWYDAEYQLLATPNAVYKATGEKLLSHNGGVGGFYVENGCAIIDSIGDYIHTEAKNGCYAITKYAVDYKGNVLNLTKRMNWPVQVVPDDTKIQKTSHLSLNGSLWAQSNERKWGLLDMT
ncbi:MAG: WG repeat-containing protein, partial [Oscillospiraceae bacterium]